MIKVIIKNIDLNKYVSYFYISDEYNRISSTAINTIYAFKFNLKQARYLLIKRLNKISKYKIEIYK